MNDATTADVNGSGPAESRLPVNAEAVRAHLGDTPLTVTWVEHTGSTNTDLADLAARSAVADRTVLLTERQDAARGRLGRPWSAPQGSQTILSVLLRPDPATEPVDPGRFGELPLFIGVAAAETAREFGAPASLKWPNDLVVQGGARVNPQGYSKLAGILVEAVSVDPPVIVVGMGLNVSMTAAEFDGAGLPAATSLVLEGADIPDAASRARFTAALLRRIVEVDRAWRGGGEDAARVRARYRDLSATLGSRVRAELPGGRVLTGTATDLGPTGELVIRTDGGNGETVTVTAGDVTHLRPAVDGRE
jgi:BirA family biotin operon repressor/biotin-[acetyl-CoA-carboxylase] ligase